MKIDDDTWIDMYGSTFTAHTQEEWDKYFLGLAEYVATKSKDPSTKVGAVIVRPDYSVASTGFNGFPQRMPDKTEWLTNREEKYSRIVHAEINSLIFCRDQSVQGYTIYGSPFMACDRCFVQLVQAGITRFVAPKPTEDQNNRWGASFDRVRKYAQECAVTLLEVDFD